MKRLLRAGGVIASGLLTAKSSPLKVGELAPDFTAASTQGELTLRRLLEKGPVVLALYHADFTPG